MKSLANFEKIEERLSTIMNRQTNDGQLGNVHKSLEDLVYEKIRDQILYHKLKPRERIIDSRLAEDLGVSRSLVRQALSILEKDEMVISIPRKGFYVKDITRKDVEEIYDIRKLLEVAAVEKAIPELTDDQIATVEAIILEAGNDLKKGIVDSHVEADILLHAMITDNCGNERLRNMINNHNNFILFYRIAHLSILEKARTLYEEHVQILEAIKKRDVEASKAKMAIHFENAKKTILENFDQFTFGKN